MRGCQVTPVLYCVVDCSKNINSLKFLDQQLSCWYKLNKNIFLFCFLFSFSFLEVYKLVDERKTSKDVIWRTTYLLEGLCRVCEFPLHSGWLKAPYPWVGKHCGSTIHPVDWEQSVWTVLSALQDLYIACYIYGQLRELNGYQSTCGRWKNFLPEALCNTWGYI